MATLRKILAHKPNRILGVSPHTSLAEAARLMSEHGVGALAVRDGDTIVGIVSERDLVLSLAKHGAGTAGEATAVAMQPVLSIDVEDDVMDGMRLMTDRRRRHVLVQERDQVIGLVSIGDLVKAVHEEQVGTISSLHQYITTG